MKIRTQETRLSSGLTILTDRMAGVRSVTLGFFYRVGSRHEPAELNGISHFIEHTLFKGTGRRSALDIAMETDRLGGNLDAFTCHEETCFVIKVIDEQLPQAFDLLADLLADPLFDEKELESEQRVIIEEMKMIEDSPEEYLGEVFNSKFFAGHPLGLSIAGTPKTVRRFDSAKTRAYHRSAFGANNLIIAAAGNVEHLQILELADRYFRNVASGGERPKSEIPSPKIYAPILIRKNRNLEQSHLIVATPFVSVLDERRYAAELLSSIFGGGTSSRLWQEVREERGLAYSVGASTAMFRDCGFFSVFAGTSPTQIEEVLDITIGQLRLMVRSGVTNDELELAKQQMVASILLSLEDSAARAATLAQLEMVYGRQISLDESIAKIRAVTVADIKQLAEEFFRTETVAFAALGDLNGLKVTRDRLAISP